MIKLNAKQISTILSVTCNSDFEIVGVETDSRLVQPGNLFVTWQGDNFDGHQFCQQAVDNGAAALLVNGKVDCDVPQVIVSDTIKAFGRLAGFWRDQFNIPVIAVTGSNGKTTTKNMLASILKSAYGDDHALAPKKSFNNHIGVPLTLSRLSAKHQVAVIEMGMNHFGEIDYITRLAKPSVATITNVAQGHLEGVGDIAGAAKAKGEIFNGLHVSGIAILNADDEYCDYWKGLVKQQAILTFALKHPADFMAANIRVSTTGAEFDLQTPQGSVPISLPLLGLHNVMNALTASACALSLGVDLKEVQQGLRLVKPEPRRLNLKKSSQGAVIIDDSYNSNPSSLHKAIDVLAQFSGETILVLGEMRELGEQEQTLHAELALYAKEKEINHLFSYGALTQAMADSFGCGAKNFKDKKSLCECLLKYNHPETVFLVKGSLSTGMGEVVSSLEFYDQ